MTMLFKTRIGITVAAAIRSAQAATLLLPGFQGRQLEARILSQNENVTTLVVTCPQSVAASACGIPQEGMTAIVARDFAELRHANKRNSTASISCDVSGTTYASCQAQQTMFIHGTLAPKDLNWMDIPVVSEEPNSIFGDESPTSSPDMEAFTRPATIPQMTACAEVPMIRNMATIFSRKSWPFWSVTASVIMIFIGYTLLLV